VKTNTVLSVSRPERGDEALRKRIVFESRELFLRRGFVPVTTGEIAERLGISKATLYKYFSSKDEMLRAAVDTVKADILAGVEAIVADTSADFLGKLSGLMTHLGDWLSRLGGVLAGDLRRNAPEVWADIDRFRREKILVNFSALLEAGIGEGVVRADLDRELFLRMFLDLVQNFINPDALFESRRSAREVFETLFKVVFEGILTDRSRVGLAGRKADPFGAVKEVPE
jgi:AcrR family transcriptional regulator